MSKKVKILIGVLIIGIILIGGWWIWETYQPVEEVIPKEEEIIKEESCSQDSHCVFLDFQCCSTPDPCKKEPSRVVNKENKEKIEQEIKAKCPPTCPQYTPPRCFNCLNLEKFIPICVDNKCTVKKEINCKEYCKAVAKDKSEPCPWISNESLLTEENTEMCGCLKQEQIIITTDNNCKIKMPNGINLQSFQRYDVEAENSNYNLITIPRDLCIDSYLSGISGYYIVQYDGSITEEKKKQVQDLGVKSYGYVPDNSYIYKMNGLTKNKVESLPFIKWIGIYQPAFRISPSITKEMISKEDTLIVDILLFDANQDVVSSQIQNMGGLIGLISKDKIRITVNASKISDMAKINNIVWIAHWTMPTIF